MSPRAAGREDARQWSPQRFHTYFMVSLVSVGYLILYWWVVDRVAPILSAPRSIVHFTVLLLGVLLWGLWIAIWIRYRSRADRGSAEV